MQALRLCLLFIAITGCGSGAHPAKHEAERIATEKTLDVASVTQHMSTDQLVLGEPLVNSIGMILVPIPAVEAPTEGSDLVSEGKLQPQMTITKPFYLSVCEVTQKQFEQVMSSRPWQGGNYELNGPNYPATQLDLNTAVEFCRKLSKLEGAEYFLPTEAQWFYASSMGATTSPTPKVKAGDYRNEHYIGRVAQDPPSSWALFNMHDNAWEFCQPQDSSDSMPWVLLGGSHFYHSEAVRSKEPIKSLSTFEFVYVGMRVARAYP